jgi:hypothetical protein
VVDSPTTEATADVPPPAAKEVEKPIQKPTSVRPQAGVSRDTPAETPIEAPASVIAPVSQAANVADTEAATLPPVSDPIAAVSVAALPADDCVYSSEGGDVVAPKLMSLGFVGRLESGLHARTSTIELVVSKSGMVERAKIFSSAVHWEDTLLLSRAKTFQFVPAQRNGFPVRYRFVMDVDTH